MGAVVSTLRLAKPRSFGVAGLAAIAYVYHVRQASSLRKGSRRSATGGREGDALKKKKSKKATVKIDHVFLDQLKAVLKHAMGKREVVNVAALTLTLVRLGRWQGRGQPSSHRPLPPPASSCPLPSPRRNLPAHL